MSFAETFEADAVAPTAKRRILPLVIAAAVALLAMAAYAARVFTSHAAPAAQSFSFFTVTPMDLEISLHPQGTLAAVDNTDIVCPIEGQSTIQTIVPEGTFAHKGDVICTLDPTEIHRKLDVDDLEAEKSRNDVKWAKGEKEIQDFKNDAEMAAAVSEKKLADIDLASYVNGEYPASVKTAERKMQIADITLKRKQEDFASSKKLADRGYMTLSEIKAAELEVVTAQNEQETAASDLLVLRNYTHEKALAEKQDKVAQAANKVARTKDQNDSSSQQKASDLDTKSRQYELHKVAAEHSRQMFEGCTIKAPADGMVLYASSVERYYSRDQPIQPGTKVMEQQLIIRLPDTSKMKAVCNVPESKIHSLTIDPSHPIRAKLSLPGSDTPQMATLTKVGVLPDSEMRWMNPESAFYPADLTFDQTPVGLKPGTTVTADMTIGRLPGVLAVPVGAVYTMGPQSYVFTRDLPRPSPRLVKLGQSSATMVQVSEGLDAGQEVVLLQAGQGQELLDFAGIKEATSQPTTAPAH